MLYKRAFRKEKEVVTFLIKIKMLKSALNLRIDPRPYQTEAAEWALAKGQAVCSLPTGTGKTLVALLWLKLLFEDGASSIYVSRAIEVGSSLRRVFAGRRAS